MFNQLSVDPSLPQFKDWLNKLGAGEYLNKFLSAGYDHPLIAELGLNDEDLDCVGIPATKMGIRKKLKNLHALSDFYVKEEAEEDEEKEEEGEEGGEGPGSDDVSRSEGGSQRAAGGAPEDQGCVACASGTVLWTPLPLSISPGKNISLLSGINNWRSGRSKSPQEASETRRFWSET